MKTNKKLLVLLLLVLLLITVFSQIVLAETTITWMMGSWWEEAAPGISEKFKEENPDINVKALLYPNAGWVEQTLILAMGPEPPNIMRVMDGGHLALLEDKGLLEVLDPYIEKTGKDPNDFFPAAWDMAKINGKVFGIPYRASSYALFMNVKMFKEAGLDPDNPPKTYDEILQYAIKMTSIKDGKYGYIIPASSKQAHIINDVAMIIWANGGNILNEDCTKAIINSPEAKAGVKFWADLYLKYKVVPEGIMAYDTNDCARLFGAGKIGMMITGIWAYGNIEETAAPDFEFKIAVPPESPTGGNFLVIPKHAKDKEATWRFIDWFTNSKNLPNLSIRTPATRSALGHPKWDDPINNVFFKSADISHAYPPSVFEWTEISDIIIQQLQKILMGKQSVDESMDEAANLINELLE